MITLVTYYAPPSMMLVTLVHSQGRGFGLCKVIGDWAIKFYHSRRDRILIAKYLILLDYIYPFLYSFNSYSLSTYYMIGTE